MRSELHLSGRLQAWERPPHLSVEEFMAQPQSELGEPVADGTNIFTNNWYQDAFTLMNGGLANLQVGALCLGTGSMAGLPTRADQVMVNEWNRYTPVVVLVGAGDPMSAIFSFFVPAADGVASITEAGLWHGGATTVAQSGRMGTHLAWTYSKTAASDVRLDYTCTRSLT